MARQSGVPEQALREYQSARRERGYGVAGIVLPDRELMPGVVVDTDLGGFDVYETPGHAPSHVVLHERERGLLISGDHLLGRVSLYYDYGWTPDPAGEFLHSLDVVDELDAGLCVSGHGRPFRDVRAHVDANRAAVAERTELVRAAIADSPEDTLRDRAGPRRRGEPHADDGQLGAVRGPLHTCAIWSCWGRSRKSAATPSVTPLRQVHNRTGVIVGTHYWTNAPESHRTGA